MRFEALDQVVQCRVIGYYRYFRVKFGDLASQELRVASSDKSEDVESLRPHTDNVEGAGAYGTCGSQESERGHGTPIIALGENLGSFRF